MADEQWRHLIGHGGAIHLETTEPVEEDDNHTYAVEPVGPGLCRYYVDGEVIELNETRGSFRVRAGDRGEVS